MPNLSDKDKCGLWGQTPKLTFHKEKTHPLILYEPLVQRAIGPLDRGEIITKKGRAHHLPGRGLEIAIVEIKTISQSY